MTMKPDQERVRGLLTDTVTLLCRNGLQYSKELRVQGLLGITLDNDDVFVVHINEVFDELLGGKVAGVSPVETDTAIASGDANSEHGERDSTKSRKGVPHKHGIHRTSSPMLHGSSKRKASLKSMSPMLRVKKEEADDDIVIMDSKPNNIPTDAIPGMSDLSGDGDREAMRMSYGGPVEDVDAPPPAKRRADPTHSNQNETFSETNTSASGAPFITGIMRNIKDNDTDQGTADVLGNASLDGSQLSSIGPLQDGQVLFDGAGAGCSNWDESQEIDEEGQEQTPGSQDSVPKETVSQTFYLTEEELKQIPEGAQLLLLEGGHMSYIVQSSEETSKQSEKSEPSIINIKPEVHVSGPKALVDEDAREIMEVATMVNNDPTTTKKEVPYKTFECEVPGCGNSYLYRNSLAAHMKRKHDLLPMPLKDFSDITFVPSGQPAKFHCTVPGCEHSYRENKNLRFHMKDKHNMTLARGEKFDGKAGSASQQEVDTGPKAKSTSRKRCKYCNGLYEKHSDILAHTRLEHTNCRSDKPMSTKRYVCGYPGCKTVRKNEISTKQHIQLSHRGIQWDGPRIIDRFIDDTKKLYICPETLCQEYYLREDALVEHEWEYHGRVSRTEIPYCQCCDSRHVSSLSPKRSVLIEPPPNVGKKRKRGKKFEFGL